jgi:hypothetical protein
MLMHIPNRTLQLAAASASAGGVAMSKITKILAQLSEHKWLSNSGLL